MFLKSHEHTELFNSDPIDIQERLFDDKKTELFAEELKKKDEISIDYINERVLEHQATNNTKKQKATKAYRDSLSKTPDVIESMAAAATDPQDPINIKMPSESEDNPESTHEPKGPVGRPQMFDISGNQRNKTQAKKEETQAKREEKAQEQKEADDLKLFKEKRSIRKGKGKRTYSQRACKST